MVRFGSSSLGRWMCVVALFLLFSVVTFSRSVVQSKSSSTSLLRNAETRIADSGLTATNEKEDLGRNLVETTPRIVGGTLASFGEYPYYAIPASLNNGLCGSVKIWDDILLSAGHCQGVFQGNNIIIGGTRLSGANAPETIRAVSELQHPNYDADTLENDFMLVKLQQKSSAPSIPWNTDRNLPSNGAQVWVIGYGYTSEEGNVSNELREVSLNIVDFSTCSDIYFGGIYDETMICAYKNNADSCLGDR